MMFPFDRSLDPWIGLTWFGALAVGAFLVTWIATDIAHMRRTWFIAVLSLVTAGLTWGYVAWTGAGAAFITYHWGWGLLGGAVSGLAMLAMARRLPRGPHGDHFRRLVPWEGFVYGVAEGVLLSVLPVAMLWQVSKSFGWTTGLPVVGAVLLVIAGSAFVTTVHHLGYPEFRNPLMRFPVALCTVLSVGYLVTGSLLAPAIGHIVVHVAMLRRGLELPPHAKDDLAMGELFARAA
jgi:MFS family permease